MVQTSHLVYNLIQTTPWSTSIPSDLLDSLLCKIVYDVYVYILILEVFPVFHYQMHKLLLGIS